MQFQRKQSTDGFLRETHIKIGGKMIKIGSAFRHSNSLLRARKNKVDFEFLIV
jgi:hypothetical protein